MPHILRLHKTLTNIHKMKCNLSLPILNKSLHFIQQIPCKKWDEYKRHQIQIQDHKFKSASQHKERRNNGFFCNNQNISLYLYIYHTYYYATLISSPMASYSSITFIISHHPLLVISFSHHHSCTSSCVASCWS